MLGAVSPRGISAAPAGSMQPPPPKMTGTAVASEAAASSTARPKFQVTMPLPNTAGCAGSARRGLGSDVSSGPSESSANVDVNSEGDGFQSSIPHLERFYEQLAAKARLPERHGSSSNWVVSLARTYHRLSKDKRRRGRLRALLQPTATGELSVEQGGGLSQPKTETPGWSSNTDDSGYEAGYETDADESELSEWESGSGRRQGHKRKLDALVHLTLRLGLSERRQDGTDAQPPWKTPRPFGPHAVGPWLPLPHVPLAAPPPSPGGSDSPSPRASPRASQSVAAACGEASVDDQVGGVAMDIG
mmetsp:Transcript_20644/g.45257  ORF Transcript_20644/g.45257 Transcript_20644/m.45257 type:complete len:303 (-) Transcript_20644:137-1045(-)|eukprot:CAMPEP_0170612092 /NCGR_PEP_ID=MMETSP0224-20130122/23540_1 /TAXON_ID=285029 /ORGANISM="Togula jolla, Strain CCCM 725" /LENGTH=302 /DNA_ID=CAMNT_0010937575 /DNA_START=217 /DNA_END=1125 /DNA_ORIENTATION=-